ncbi:Vacuolar fusion protein mon1 [Malassezia yamatoensis]|uniref:Small ribosomal subunit protein mS41 n=1 Tax=Malassezia yamatoensis TaxID=253288 RepID=A0AAJ5YQL5_9BASI|nr:Vacuolar fusion protein mon1 [Malassezia yamatoensis]
MVDEDKIDQEFLVDDEMPMNNMPDWSDRSVEALDVDTSSSSQGTAKSGQIRKWIAWGLKQYQPENAREIEGVLGVPRSQSLPTQLSEEGVSESVAPQSDLQTFATLARTVWLSSRKMSESRAKKNNPSDGVSTEPQASATPNYETVDDQQAGQLIALGDTSAGAKEIEFENKPKAERFYSPARLWKSNQAGSRTSEEVPVPRRRNAKSKNQAGFKLSSKKEPQKVDENQALNQYINSLEEMLGAVGPEDRTKLSLDRRIAIRAKLEQGLKELDVDRPTEDISMSRSGNRVPVIVETYVVPSAIYMAVASMRIALPLMAFLCHSMGVKYKLPQKRQPAIRVEPAAKIPPAIPPRPTKSSTDGANVSESTQPEQDEVLPRKRKGNQMATILTMLTFLDDPKGTLKRSTAKALLASADDSRRPNAEVQSIIDEQNMSISASSLQNDASPALLNYGWARTAAVSARALKRSPLPYQMQLLANMLWAVVRHIERRLKIWSNVSSFFVLSINNLIHCIKTNDFHILIVRAFMATVESFFAAILAYQSEPSVVETESSSRTAQCFVRLASSAAYRPVPPPRGSTDSPMAFLKAISKTRRNLAENSSCVNAVGNDWDAMFRLNSYKLKGEGVPVKERKYLLWALDKYREGGDPYKFAYDTKKKKVVRGWGPRVQKNIRVRGMLRPGERRA